ncbi:MAG: hypothetical protein M3Y70_00725 [Pseudomonadota bacterium]|nr:hypothetical protein [Pseudomonadota bacterium]
MQTRIAAAVTAIGVALLVYMVVVEGEPGALPLALVLGGTAWFFIARHRARRPQ